MGVPSAQASEYRHQIDWPVAECAVHAPVGGIWIVAGGRVCAAATDRRRIKAARRMVGEVSTFARSYWGNTSTNDSWRAKATNTQGGKEGHALHKRLTVVRGQP
jgi:hypothetical protein